MFNLSNKIRPKTDIAQNGYRSKQSALCPTTYVTLLKSTWLYMMMDIFAFQSAKRGDVVIGLVSAIQDGGMLITLECLDNGKARDIHALKINVSKIFMC